MEDSITFGGQAVIEGVMMKGPKSYAVSVRDPKKKIVTKIFPTKPDTLPMKIPFIRGIFKLVDTLGIGMNALTYSANLSVEEEEQLSSNELTFTIILGIGMTIFLFFFLPLFLSGLITKGRDDLVFNLIDGLMRLVIFISYILAISMMKDVKRLFQYHGAEHKVVNCYESGEKLTVKNVMKQSVSHPRCGTTFLLLVVTLSIILFTFIPVRTFIYRFIMRLAFLPIVAGISYEILKFSANHYKNPIVKMLISPGLLLQRLTTREPDEEQAKVSMTALKTLLYS